MRTTPKLLFWGSLACAVAFGAGCSHSIFGQPIGKRRLVANPADFEVNSERVAMHYYGSGGWGIAWRDTYIMMAPYFSNYNAAELVLPELFPKEDAIHRGLANTPAAKTKALLIGHGHVDHAGDVPTMMQKGLFGEKPTLIADRSTVNILNPQKDLFGCIQTIDYDANGNEMKDCPTGDVRVTAIHSSHAFHYSLFGLKLELYTGRQATPRKTTAAAGEDFKKGNTWAFVVDLLDAQGNIAFRIHYMDAAGAPPHGIIPKKILAERDVDVHIGCIPGFDTVEEYPEVVVAHHRTRYVLGGHWEDFFRPTSADLRPVPPVLDDKGMEVFLTRAIRALREDTIEPIQPRPEGCAKAGTCGPHGKGWSVPLPGETFQFRVAPGP